jgi:hypothetical protein
MAVVNGTTKCSVFSTARFELVQEIPCQVHSLTSLVFDPSGTMLAIGGETESFQSRRGGVVLVVRVGELLRSRWFFSNAGFADPPLLFKKLSGLRDVERAQLLVHKTTDGEEGHDHGLMPLEQWFRDAIDSNSGQTEMLGSHMLTSRLTSDLLVACLQEVFKQFPQTVFAVAPGHGNMFEVALERVNPRLLTLVFSAALVACRSYPYLMMSEEMRNGAVTDALIATCDTMPEGSTSHAIEH